MTINLQKTIQAKSLSTTDGHGDVLQAVIDLRHSIQNIVKQSSQGLGFADLQDGIAALTADVAELQNALRESFAKILDSYDEARALDTWYRGILRKTVQQNPDVAAMVLGQGPASGSGSKLTLAIDMVDVLEKELERMDVILVEKDNIEASDVVETLFTLSEAVVNTAEWMHEAVNNFSLLTGTIWAVAGPYVEMEFDIAAGAGVSVLALDSVVGKWMADSISR